MLVQLRSKALDPSPDRGMIHVHTPLREQFLHIAIGQTEAEIAPDRVRKTCGSKCYHLKLSGRSLVFASWIHPKMIPALRGQGAAGLTSDDHADFLEGQFVRAGN